MFGGWFSASIFPTPITRSITSLMTCSRCMTRGQKLEYKSNISAIVPRNWSPSHFHRSQFFFRDSFFVFEGWRKRSIIEIATLKRDPIIANHLSTVFIPFFPLLSFIPPSGTIKKQTTWIHVVVVCPSTFSFRFSRFRCFSSLAARFCDEKLYSNLTFSAPRSITGATENRAWDLEGFFCAKTRS